MIINANYITEESNSKPKTKIYIVNPEVSAIESEALEIFVLGLLFDSSVI